jgi:hypothetical protein
MRAPNEVKAETIQENCKSLVFIIVDKTFFIGCTTLGWIEFMCRFGMNTQSLSLRRTSSCNFSRRSFT